VLACPKPPPIAMWRSGLYVGLVPPAHPSTPERHLADPSATWCLSHGKRPIGYYSPNIKWSSVSPSATWGKSNPNARFSLLIVIIILLLLIKILIFIPQLIKILIFLLLIINKIIIFIVQIILFLYEYFKFKFKIFI